MNNCKTCNGSGLVPIRDEKGKIINLMPPEQCPDCNGSGLDSSSDDLSDKDQEYDNSLLNFTINVWRNQNPLEL